MAKNATPRPLAFSYDPYDPYVMETSLTIDYDKQWLNCVSAIGPICSPTLFVAMEGKRLLI